MTSLLSLPAAAVLLLVPFAVHALEPPEPSAIAAPQRAHWQVITTADAARRPHLVVIAPPGRLVEGAAPISLSVKDADLVEVVRSLARIAGLNLVLDPSVSGTVTAELTDVPWDRALAVILKINGLAMELDGSIVTVAPPARLHALP